MIPGRAAAALPANLPGRAKGRVGVFSPTLSNRSCQFLMLPGEVSFDLGFSGIDTRQLCQVVRQLISHSRHCLFEPSQLSSGLGDPHGVD